MTKEEATKWLKTFKGRTGMAELSQAFGVAIQALEQEPCTDVISRQAAIDCLNANFTIDGKENMETVVDYINGAFKQIKALPSITPQPFINKPCVSEGVCREDKIQVLDKIKEEIKDNTYFINETTEKEGIDFETVEKIINKYKAESEVKE